jgi:hypothetical protein
MKNKAVLNTITFDRIALSPYIPDISFTPRHCREDKRCDEGIFPLEMPIKEFCRERIKGKKVIFL